jgi:hypothetical protein
MRHPRKRKLDMVCSLCGSGDVLCDAYAEWDIQTQTWELASTFEKGAFCNECGGETSIEVIEIAPGDTRDAAREAWHGQGPINDRR